MDNRRIATSCIFHFVVVFLFFVQIPCCFAEEGKEINTRKYASLILQLDTPKSEYTILGV